jgi:HPt (histidine-containing phosphotransfer) domain-containing protein
MPPKVLILQANSAALKLRIRYKAPAWLQEGHAPIRKSVTVGPRAPRGRHLYAREMGDSAGETARLGGSSLSEEPGDAPAPPVDLVHLSRYTLGARALQGELLELFRTQSVVYVERLAAARSETEWRDAAHSLKGSARAIGAWRAAAAADRAEALPEARQVHLAEVEATIREANAYIDALLAAR